MRILYAMCILLLLLFFVGMLSLRRSVVRGVQQSTRETLSHRAIRWGLPPEQLLAAADALEAQAAAPLSIAAFDGIRLEGRWFAAKKSRGRVLLFHGYRSGGVEDFAEAIPFYQALGLDVLLADQRACGKSEGKFIGMGILEKRDCLSWLEAVNKRFGAEVPTFLAGVSMGATTVLLAAGEGLMDNVRGVIADCGFTTPRDIIAYRLRRELHLPPWPLVPLTSALCRLLAGYGFGDGSTVEAVGRNAVPVLFLHGEADDYVPVEMTLEAHAACRSEKRLVLVPEAEHAAAFSMGGGAVRQAIADFVTAHLA